MEKRNLAKLAVVGVSLAVCTGAAFWDTGGETEALQATQQAVGSRSGQANLLGELGNTLAALGHLAQGTQQCEQPRHAARADFLAAIISLSEIQTD